MSDMIQNYIGGQWVVGDGPGNALFDPVTGEELVRVSGAGLDLAGGFEFARHTAGRALRAMTYGERAAMLGAVSKVLQANRDAYFEISTANSGTTKADTSIDVDGAIFTLGYFARAGAALADARTLVDGAQVSLAKDAGFGSRHILSPGRGLALLINAFNFPAWGLWEKAAPALLSGVPVVVKPATSTAWLTQRMVADVVAAGVLPPGALSVVCGGHDGLLDALQPFDMLSFTGSAATAARIRRHASIAERSVRVNVEADSLNSAVLLPGQGDEALDLLTREVVRELTQKSGQKCTAIRRILVPQEAYAAAGQAIAAKLASVIVGNPRNDSVRMGALVSRSQFEAVREYLGILRTEAKVLHDGASHDLVDADPNVAACIGPSLLAVDDPDAAVRVHDTEVFGPAATLLPYRDIDHAVALAARGEGSLVASVYGQDADAAAHAAGELAPYHGRIHVITPDVAKAHTGHGNVMPQSLHGGPGRAGGGEELGGLRALGFYHRRTAIQGSDAVLAAMGGASTLAS